MPPPVPLDRGGGVFGLERRRGTTAARQAVVVRPLPSTVVSLPERMKTHSLYEYFPQLACKGGEFCDNGGLTVK